MTVSAQRIDFLPRRELGKHVHWDRGNYQSKNILMPRSIPLDGVRSTQMPGKLAGHQKNVSMQDTKRKKYGGIWRKHLFFPPGNLLINGNATTRFGNSQGISVKALGLLGLCGLDSRLRKNGMGGREWPGENHGLVSPFHRPNDCPSGEGYEISHVSGHWPPTRRSPRRGSTRPWRRHSALRARNTTNRPAAARDPRSKPRRIRRRPFVRTLFRRCG